MSKYHYLKKLNLKNPWHLAAVGFGSGLVKFAPGTFGSIAAIPFCLILLYLPWYINLIVIILSFILGTIACNKAEQAMGIHDHGGIVIDEFVGMFISSLFFPQNPYLIILSFILFRFFDILKPYPISLLDRNVKGGFGIMIDDVIAGIYALIVGMIIISVLQYYSFLI